MAHKPVFHLLQALVSVTLQHKQNKALQTPAEVQENNGDVIHPAPEEDCPLGGVVE